MAVERWARRQSKDLDETHPKHFRKFKNKVTCPVKVRSKVKIGCIQVAGRRHWGRRQCLDNMPNAQYTTIYKLSLSDCCGGGCCRTPTRTTGGAAMTSPARRLRHHHRRWHGGRPGGGFSCSDHRPADFSRPVGGQPGQWW